MTWPELQYASQARLTAADTASPSVVDGLAALDEALAALEATDPDTDSMAYDRATDKLIASARQLARASVPNLANPTGLHQAVTDAIAGRRDLTAWCRDCERRDTESGLCGDHEADLLQAASYERLLPALTRVPSRDVAATEDAVEDTASG